MSGQGVPYYWLPMVQTNLAALQALQLTAKLQPAQQALIKAGQTIVDTYDSGSTVWSDDAKQWLYSAKQFAMHLSAAQGAPIIQTSNAGMATPDDGIAIGLAQGANTFGQMTTAAIQGAMSDLQKALQDIESLPWGWIAVGIGAIVVAPMLAQELLAAPPPRKRRRA